jgi:hypothetical protein
MATFISDSNNLRTDSKYRIQHYEQPPPLSRTAPRSLITAGCKRLVTQSNAITVFIGQ